MKRRLSCLLRSNLAHQMVCSQNGLFHGTIWKVAARHCLKKKGNYCQKTPKTSLAGDWINHLFNTDDHRACPRQKNIHIGWQWKTSWRPLFMFAVTAKKEDVRGSNIRSEKSVGGQVTVWVFGLDISCFILQMISSCVMCDLWLPVFCFPALFLLTCLTSTLLVLPWFCSFPLTSARSCSLHVGPILNCETGLSGMFS